MRPYAAYNSGRSRRRKTSLARLEILPVEIRLTLPSARIAYHNKAVITALFKAAARP